MSVNLLIKRINSLKIDESLTLPDDRKITCVKITTISCHDCYFYRKGCKDVECCKNNHDVIFKLNE